ncbi:MAG: GNAT family N-acetyltransferase [Novosphingobium sp.]|nr:GNAT family N-acetyltransferase [Novosphingobium sp.]
MTHTVIADPRRSRLSLRLAETEDDLRSVQRLRWQVFHEEMGAGVPSLPSENLDSDVYDPLCDHLIVSAVDGEGIARAVGTYRLLRGSVASRSFGFYTAGEFSLDMLMDRSSEGELLELGRSCVLPAYRTSSTISMLWRGISEYIARHDIALMFGCASLPGTDPDIHAEALSYLYHNHLASPDLRPVPVPGKRIEMERCERGAYDERRALLGLPPLIKGYLRAGAMFGDGAYLDADFNTIDVCVVLPVDLISSRYAARFRAAA